MISLQGLIAENVYDIPTIVSMEELKEFLVGLKPTLKILEEPLSTYYLGKGAYGRAFELKGTDKVLKITTDTTETAMANQRIGKKAKSVVNVYDIESFTYRGKSVDLIIVDLLQPAHLSPAEIAQMKTVAHILEDRAVDTLAIFISKVQELKTQNYWSGKVLNFLKRLVDDINADIVELGAFLYIHGGNILQNKQKELILIDN
jgi:hypothetical protein